LQTFGMSHPDLWLAEKSGRNTVNTFNLELSQSGGAGSTAENLRDDKGSITAERFRRFGVLYVVTIEPGARERLLATNEFREISVVDRVSILRVLAPPGTPDAASLVALNTGTGRAKLDRVSGGHYALTTRVPKPVNATVAVGWSSSWRVSIDGKHVPVKKSVDGLVQVRLPKGTHHVSLEFHRDLVGALGLLIGLATAVAMARWVRRD
jgi:hypothetical protein